MKPRFGSQALCLGCLVWSALPGAAARAGETFSLLSAVPDDVFFCVAERHNPERQFVTDYWDGVWQAVVQTGLGADLMDLVGSAGGEEQLAEAQRIKDLATQLLGQVDWGQLVGKEFVYAMRMPELVKSDHGMSAGGPDQVWLLAGAEGSGAKNFDGIVGLTNTVLGMAAQAGLPPMKLQMSEKAGARVASLHFPPTQTEGVPSYGLGIAQRGDVIVITLGNRILDEVLGLLSGSGSGKALVASARFKEAFASLPAAEDEVVYFDMQRMLTQLRALTDPIFEAMATAGDSDGADDQPALADQFKNANLKPEADEFVRQAFKAYNRKEYAHALQLTQKAHGLAPNDSVVLYNLACYSAITNKPDEALDWLDKAVDAGFYAPRKISTDPDLAGLRDDPRFEATLAKAKGYAQGDSPESSDGQQWAVVAKTLVERVYGALGVMDHSAAVGYTEGYSERGESVCAMSPGADKLPFYAIACRRPPIKDYAKYLPVETTSFSVNSGIDVPALYDFIEQTVRELGPPGEQALAKWADLQQSVGINLRADVLSWLQGQSIEISLRLESGDASVHLIRVTDEAAAREKIEAALKFLGTALTEMASSNPMLSMLAIRTAPASHEKLTGFQNIFMQVSPQPMVLGVADGFIIFGSSEQAAALCLATAAGEHPNVTKNEQIMAEALLPEGDFYSVSFTDLRQLGAQLSQVIGVVQMVGGMASMGIPDPHAQKIVAKLMGMLGKLMPAAQKINFFRSKASVTTFDGKVFRTRSATHYVAPAAQPQPAG